jgi:hypothetical protein
MRGVSAQSAREHGPANGAATRVSCRGGYPVRIAMPNLARLPTWAEHELVHVVVETPRGARAKLTFDPELKTFVLSKALMLGLSYPYDWGFIPSTRAEDGDRSTRWSFMTPRPRRAWCCAARSLAFFKRFKKPSTTKSAMIRHRRSERFAPRARCEKIFKKKN